MIKKNKTNDICIEYLRRKWREILTTRFEYFLNVSPESAQRMHRIMDAMIKTMENVFLEFSGLKDSQFNGQIMSDDEGVYSQRLAELLFYYRLRRTGFGNFRSKDAGPDFVATKNGETFCFEIVTPTPNQAVRALIARGGLTIEERNFLFRERLLSVTSVLGDKLKKLAEHQHAGHVPDGAHYIIVVNDSMLLPYDKAWYGAWADLCFGDSTLPIIVDATLGSGDVDLGIVTAEGDADEATGEFRKLIIKSNFSISINGGNPVIPEDAALRVNIRQEIATRNRKDAIFVDIAESAGAAGFYQITLREDIFFYHVFPAHTNIMPKSALVTSVKNKNLIRKAVLHTSSYAKDEDLVQPLMSPALLIGRQSDEFNHQVIYDNFFKPYLSGGEFYSPPAP